MLNSKLFLKRMTRFCCCCFGQDRIFSSSGSESLGCYLQPTARGCSLRESIEERPTHRSGYPPATPRREDLPAFPLPVLQTRGGLPAADLQSLPR